MLFAKYLERFLPSNAGTFECGFYRSVHRIDICEVASIPEPVVLMFCLFTFQHSYKGMSLFYTNLVFMLSASSAFNQRAYAEQK